MDVARKENMQHVFLASNATRLSIQLLTDVAQGKGSQINSEIVSICFKKFFCKLLQNVWILWMLSVFWTNEMIWLRC